MNLTIRQIQVFLAVAELGNFTRAAERMHMAQPALSQQVRGLEKALGVRLFDRTSRRVELTDAGREFCTAATKILQDLELAARRATDLAQRKRGRIVIAAPPLLAGTILPQAIAEFCSLYPGIVVSVIDARTDKIVESVGSGQADCGIGTFSPVEDTVERKPLARDSLMLFCSQDSLFFGENDVHWRDLKDHSLVTLTRDSGIRLLVEVGFETAQIPLRPAYEVSLVTTAIGLVEAGLGCAVLPSYACAAAQNRKVAVRTLSNPSISRDIVLIQRRDRSVSPAVSAFEPVIRRCVRQFAPRSST